MSTPKRVYIHADPNGTYLGNGGFICLNELGYRLQQMGYPVAWFDPSNRLNAEMWCWTGYDVPPIVQWETVASGQPNDQYVIVTTWLYSWLSALEGQPHLFPHIRYWCSGELLRDEDRYNPTRSWLRAYCPTIAINNPALDRWYRVIGLEPRYQWTNWVRDLFHADPEHRQPRLIGYQPDNGDGDPLRRLRAQFGLENVLECTGTQSEVARKMRQCSYFVVWNHHWPMICGGGESFGLSTYEAMASGCITLNRAHCGNAQLPITIVRTESFENVVTSLYSYMTSQRYEHERREQLDWVNTYFRWDYPRENAVREYLDG